MNVMIQPELKLAVFTCVTCGTEITTRTVGAGQRLDVCSNCHPAYTGRERATATGSRIERFERRLSHARA